MMEDFILESTMISNPEIKIYCYDLIYVKINDF